MEIKVRFLTTRKRQDGTTAHYWQPDSKTLKLRDKKGNPLWKVERLPDDEASAITRAQDLNRQFDAWREGEQATNTAITGTMDALIADYKTSEAWHELAESTRKNYDWFLGLISAWSGDVPVRAITPGAVNKFYLSMKKATPTKAAGTIRVLRLLLEHGRRKDWISANPAANPGIKNKDRKKGRLWTPQEVQLMAAACDADGDLDAFSIGTAIMLNEWLGQRLGDVIRLARAIYRDGKLHIRQSKTDAEVVLPVDKVPHLKARLEAQLARVAHLHNRTDLLLVNNRGEPFTEDWFSHRFAAIRNELAKQHPAMEGLVFMHLRHTAITRMGEAGIPTQQIASVSGHSFKTCEEILDLYNIRTAKMAEQAFDQRLQFERSQSETRQSSATSEARKQTE